MPRRSEAAVRQTRLEILGKAVDLASVEGLGGLTIGRLASSLSLSKSGLFAHFGSKEELQLAVVERGREIFESEVFGGSETRETGLLRLAHLTSAWIAYMERGHFRGGCFFAAVSSEMDDKPGRVRETIVALTRAWCLALEEEVSTAIEAGHLEVSTDNAQLVFEVHAFLQEANRDFQLHGDSEVFRRARRAIRRTLDAVATAGGRALLGSASPSR